MLYHKSNRYQKGEVARMDSTNRFSRVFSIILTLGLIVSGLTVLCAPISADQDIRQDWLELVFDDQTQIDGLSSPFTDRVFDRQNQWNEYRPGEGDGAKDWDTMGATENDLNVDIRILDSDCDDLYINITGVEEDSWWDFDDTGDTITPDAFPVASSIAGNNYAAGTVATATWNFDILVTDYIGHGDETEITCSYSYWDNNAAERRTGSFDIYIHLSTLYDNSAFNEDHVTTLPDLAENTLNDDGAFFEAGDVFADTQLTLPNHLGEAVSDIWINITPPAASGITVDAGGTAWFPGSLAGGGTTQVFNYRTNVDLGTLPGRYTGTASIEYSTGAGLRITEPDAPIDWLVDFSFRDDDPKPENQKYSFDQMQVTAATLIDDGSGTRLSEHSYESYTVVNEGSNTVDIEPPILPYEEEVESRNGSLIILLIGITTVFLMTLSAIFIKGRLKE
jgi:hypothetical protein